MRSCSGWCLTRQRECAPAHLSSLQSTPFPGRAQHGGGQKKCEGKVGAPGCRPDPRPGPQPRQPAASGRGGASAASRGARCGPPPPPPPPAPGCSSEWALRLRGRPLPSPGCRTPRRKEPRTQCRGALRPPQGTDRLWGTCSIVCNFLGPSCGPLEPGDAVMSRHLRRTMLGLLDLNSSTLMTSSLTMCSQSRSCIQGARVSAPHDAEHGAGRLLRMLGCRL